MCAGLNDTQVSVAQYGDTNTAELTWRDEQSKSNLLKLVENIRSRTAAAPALGSGYIMCAHTLKQKHTLAHTLTALSVCRLCAAIRCADGHFATQWWTTRCGQGCGDVGD